MYAVGVFSVGKKCFASILPILRRVDLLYFEIYVDFACYIIKRKILTIICPTVLNIITYPWISAPFGEISPLGYSSLLLLLP